MAEAGPRDAEIRDLVASTAMLGRVSGREPWRELLLRLTGGRWPRRSGWPVVPRLATPWQDTVSNERIGWRMRAANLRAHDPDDASVRDEFVFEVDYQLCRRCRIGWVEQPHTLPAYRRRGLAAAGSRRCAGKTPATPGTRSGGTSTARRRSGTPLAPTPRAATGPAGCASTSPPVAERPGRENGAARPIISDWRRVSVGPDGAGPSLRRRVGGAHGPGLVLQDAEHLAP